MHRSFKTWDLVVIFSWESSNQIGTFCAI